MKYLCLLLFAFLVLFFQNCGERNSPNSSLDSGVVTAPTISNKTIAASPFDYDFEETTSLDSWKIWNNCSPGSTAERTYFFPTESIEGDHSLRMVTKNFKKDCEWPGVFADSPAHSVVSGQTVKVSSRIRNGKTIAGNTAVIFLDEDGQKIPSDKGGSSYKAWNNKGPWDWPNHHKSDVLFALAPEGASSFKIRFELTQENSIVDIDAIDITGNKFKGFFFNPKAINGNDVDINIAWQLWLTRDSEIEASVQKELLDLINKVRPTHIHLMIGANLVGWPAKDIDPHALWSLSYLINMAWAQGVQVGLSLNTHCFVNQNYAEVIGQTGPKQYIGAPYGELPACPKDNIRAAKAWYRAMIKGVENKIVDKRAIAYWEFSGNPYKGMAEIPLWDFSPWTEDVEDPQTGQIYPGVATFVSEVFTYMKTQTTRPTAITVLPVPLEPYTQDSTDISSISNLKDILGDSSNYPDYFIIGTGSNIPIHRIIQEIPQEKIILGDFFWKQYPHAPEYNPSQFSAEEIAKRNFDYVRDLNLAGYYVWGYRDDKEVFDMAEGIRRYDNSWKEPLTSMFIHDIIGNNF